MGRAPLWSLPSPLRPAHGSIIAGICFAALFNTSIALTWASLVLLYPLTFSPATRRWYFRVTKQSFGCACVLISQLFAPTTFVVSGGQGVDTERWVERDASGRVKGLRLAERGVWVSNHQTLCDWLYIWSFAYLSHHHGSVLITLKASLRRIPIIGWACSLYGFIFLARNWMADKVPFKRQLQKVSEILEGGKDEKLALLIFPEGTLVTGNTRPKSLAYAGKLGIPDLKHTLLPRSTGLFFTLRNLAATVPEGLHLVDLTIAYPGTLTPSSHSPSGGARKYWPEDYYSLTIWFKGVAPPSIHVHVRQFPIKDIPLGKLDDGDGTDEEKAAFDSWLRARWTEKDELMAAFERDGSFVGLDTKDSVEWPLELRSRWEYLETFSYFLPVVAVVGAFWGIPSLWRYVTGSSGSSEPVLKACCAAKTAAAALAKASAEAAWARKEGRIEL